MSESPQYIYLRDSPADPHYKAVVSTWQGAIERTPEDNRYFLYEVEFADVYHDKTMGDHDAVVTLWRG